MGQLTEQRELLSVDVIARNALLHRDRPAVVCEQQRLSWRELDARTGQVANALAGLGLGRGDNVAQLQGNSLETFVTFWGIVRAGCVAVPLNVMLDDESLARLLNDSDARVLFADETTRAQLERVQDELSNIGPDTRYLFGEAAEGWSSAEALIAAAPDSAPAVSIDPSDPMTILYSSGTTGTPKGILHSHRARTIMYSIGFSVALGADRYSKAVLATPAYASGTWICMFPVMYRGGTVVITKKWDCDTFLQAVQDEGGTHAFLVPTQFIALTSHPRLGDYDLSSLRKLVSAGQSLDPVTRAAVDEAFPEAGFHEVYGMTEGFCTLRTPADDAAGKQRSVGLPMSLEIVKIVGDDDREVPLGEDGEICVNAVGAMKGYYKNDALTAEATWHDDDGLDYMRSGDMGHVDDEGFIYVNGRKKDMIKSGGINVYAIDIESVFMAHEAVRECAAVARRDDKWGETPVLGVLLQEGKTVDPEELRAWGNESLARYQRVSEVIVCDDFPRATYGKVAKNQLRAKWDVPAVSS